MNPEIPSPTKALGILAVVVLLLGGFVALMLAIGNGEAWAGFLFLTYWSLAEQMKIEALPKSVGGALTGLAVASLGYAAPAALGTAPGIAAFLAAVLVLVYLSLRMQAPVLVNMATMIFLTVGAIPHVLAHADYGQVLVSLLLGVLYFGGVGFLLAALEKRRAGAPAAPAE